MDTNTEKQLVGQIAEAAAQSRPLNITGGGSKAFYGRIATGTRLEVTGHSGIVSYEPSELVLTARAGTPIDQIQTLLGEHGQMLGFEPAFSTAQSTLGGVIAAGLAGPRRPYAGAVRDFILGVKIINGNAEVLNFGGQVMKNVAGFDHSRLMTGAMGTLGVLLEISLRVVPEPEIETTLVLEQTEAGLAIEHFNKLAGHPLPLSAAAWVDGHSYIRLSGTRAGVSQAAGVIGGDQHEQGSAFWQHLQDHALDQPGHADSVLRVSLPAATPPLTSAGEQIMDWGGAQRWIIGETESGLVEQVQASGGHLSRFRGGDREGEVFPDLPPVLMQLHKKIKQAFDPKGLFNSGRLYKDI